MEGISILITAYQTKEFIQECVYSLLHQKCEVPFEILIAIDGCQSTLEEIKDIPNIGIFTPSKNVGTFTLRNSLVKKAKYDKILFFDSDDVALDGLVKYCYQSLKNSEASRVRYYDFRKRTQYNSGKKQAFGVMAIRKEVFLSVNGYQAWRFGADSEFVSRLEQSGKKIELTNNHYFLRRVHPNSLTQHPDTGMKSEARQVLRAELIPKIQNGTLEDPKKLKTTTLKTMQKPIDINPEKHKIGIGITTFNRPQQLSESLASIKKHTPLNVKIVVVDDGSNIPVPEATFRFEKNQGAPIAKNKCLELLDDCEHIFLFDDDTYPISEGWEKAYINSQVKHLNYTFKYPFEVVKGVRHLQNPNGCMMYIHRSVLDGIGGFDTGFIKYGYWHGAFSNRVFNAGLIQHPFIDIQNSGDYIYCLDQKPSNRTATRNRGLYLSRNKRRYNEKVKSKEFIPYKKSKEVRIFYSNPYNTSKNIGKGLNEFCSLIPDDAWICLQDGDMMYLTPDWGVQIEEAIKRHGKDFDVIGCMTNRLARDTQRLAALDDNHDIIYHHEIAKEERDKNWGQVVEVQKPIAGMFMLFKKSLWERVKFKENDIAFDDSFCKVVKNQGGKFGVMTGLYVYHFYRGWSDNPTKDRKHLKK